MDAEIVIIGGGIAGASAGYELAAHYSVLLLEMEDQPGYHSTGRSAALFSETYGNEVIRALAVGSRSFLESPPEGFCEHPLLTDRGVFYLGREEQKESLEKTYDATSKLVDSIEKISPEFMKEKVPILKEGYAIPGVWEPDAMDIDVDGLHQGFLRGLKQRGGKVLTRSRVEEMISEEEGWIVKTEKDSFKTRWVINAAGAWAGKVGEMVGAISIGLVPKRRTVILFDPPKGMEVEHWPMVIDADEDFYFKPDAGRILASPADETPIEPCDVKPKDLDVAIIVDRLDQATSLDIRKIEHKWAGLRSFVKDKTPVVGFDEKAPNFFWLAGQGGYGIQTAPAIARCCLDLFQGKGIPEDLQKLGVTEERLSASRFLDPT